MKLFKKKCLSILAFIVIPLLLLGCSSKKEEAAPNVAEDIKLNSGAVLKSEEGTYKVYNYENGKYAATKCSNIIWAYDKNSSSYISIEDNKPSVVHNGNKFEIKDLNYSDLKLSKDGGYISYFIEDNGLKLKIYDTSGKEIEMKSDVSISGTLYDWYDVNTLVYYGVSNDGVNGLFTYNIKENKEELLYKIKEGYLAYIKGTLNNVVFLQLTLENNKELVMIDKKTKDVKILTNNIEELSDIITDNEKIYFTGKVADNVSSLYELTNNKAKRLVFDFPAVVKTEKGLTTDDDGNVLFIGCNSGNTNVEQIYTYKQDGSISAVSKDSADYAFLDYRS